MSEFSNTEMSVTLKTLCVPSTLSAASSKIFNVLKRRVFHRKANEMAYFWV